MHTAVFVHFITVHLPHGGLVLTEKRCPLLHIGISYIREDAFLSKEPVKIQEDIEVKS